MSDVDHAATIPAPERRSFLIRMAALVMGGIAVLFPFAAGFGVLFHPMRKRHLPSQTGDALTIAQFARICALDALPADGVPREFVVTADVADAWTRSTGQRIGSVFVLRSEDGGEPHVRAFSATCPHLGCAVEFDAADNRFECPCHESAFAKDGQKLFGPSLRGLDPLEVRLVESGGSQEVWVAYERYRAGVAERISLG